MMNRNMTTEDNSSAKRTSYNNKDSTNYNYNTYNSNSISINQPLPGQPPLPPMPPPPLPGSLPPLPHVFSTAVQLPQLPQVTQIQTWTHAAPTWQWMTPQTTVLSSQSSVNNMQTNHLQQQQQQQQQQQANRAKFNRRNRFNNQHNINVVYPQRSINNFNRNNKNRRQSSSSSSSSPQSQSQSQSQSQQQQLASSYFSGQVLQLHQQQQQQQQQQQNIDWQRINNYNTNNNNNNNSNSNSNNGNQIGENTNKSASPMSSSSSSEQQHNNNNNNNNNNDKNDSCEREDIKIVSEITVKKTKQRKPMSQNYPSRPWNLKDAETALAIERDYNQRVRAQSLIIKFPDPDLNKDVVRKFHDGIQNIHFQSPSGPRYCFVQMAENVNIDEAIKELEKIKFGVGYLKVERKALKKEEEDLRPEIIDPYTLYVGNLPETVNVNELKSKFPTATRVDVGYAQKMRNTRYAFVRYPTVEESIAVYKKSQDLMWDTRSTIVRFRRDKKNKTPQNETNKNINKKVKIDPDNALIKKEDDVSLCNGKKTIIDNSTNNQIQILNSESTIINNKQIQIISSSDNQQALTTTTTATSDQIVNNGINIVDVPNDIDQLTMITTIKEEPLDVLDDESYLSMNDDDDDDDDSDDENNIPDEMDDTNDDNDDDDDDDDDDDNLLDSAIQNSQDNDNNKNSPDNLDHMFDELENIGDLS